MTISIPFSGRQSFAVTPKGLWRGAVAGLPFLLSSAIAGVVMGIAYREAGFTLGTATIFSVVVYSATAQAVTLAMWTHPLPLGAMVLACIAVNLRYLLLGAHLRVLFAQADRRVMLPTLFLLADASWLLCAADTERHGPDAGFLLGSSLIMAVGWIAGTALGFTVPAVPDGPLAGVATLLPLIFIATLVPTQWKGTARALPWTVAVATAILAGRFVEPQWAMLLGGMGGTFVDFLRDIHA